MVTAQLTDLGEQPIEIGMPVEMVTRKMRNDGDERGVIVYGYKFRRLFRKQHNKITKTPQKILGSFYLTSVQELYANAR